MFRIKNAIVALAAVLCGSLAAPVQACPFCTAPSLTLAEQVSQSDAVVLVKWVEGKKSDGRLPGNTTYEIEKIAKGSQATLKEGGKVVLGRYLPGKPGQHFALMGTRTATIDWGTPLEVSKTAFDYFTNAPDPKEDATKRLAYFLNFLEFPDDLVANDAYGEFANAPYKEIAKLADKYPRERLQKWVAGSDTAPTRLGLYGLLLGLCGEEEDAKIMKAKILEKSKEYRLGIEGVMSGYMLLKGEEALEVLEEAKLENKDAPFSETYAAMQAVGFMWDYAPGKIKKQRLRVAMRTLLDRPTTADLVIANLARWKDWEVQDRLMKLYDDKEYNIPAVKRAVVRFLLVCSKEAKPDAPNSEIPPHVKKARENLAILKNKDPKTVQDAERFFF